MFPMLPWHQLRTARELVREQLGSGYQEVIGLQWNVENRQKDPEEVFLKSRETDWYI
jgi:fatty acid desaturase